MSKKNSEIYGFFMSDEWKDYRAILVDHLAFAQEQIQEALSEVMGSSECANFCRFHLSSAYDTLEKAVHYIED